MATSEMQDALGERDPYIRCESRVMQTESALIILSRVTMSHFTL